MRGFFKFRRNNPGQVWAWATYDFANSAFATTILAVVFNSYYAGVVAGGSAGVALLGTRIPGATLFSFWVTLSMVLIALASPLLGALSDLTGSKRRFLAIHAAIGILSTSLLYTVHEGAWLWGGLLFLFAQFGFAGGNIFYNAMLNDLAEPEDFGKVSGLGWAWGYIGGGLLLALNLVMLQYPHWLGLAEGTFTVQDCFLSVGIWWLIFSLPVLTQIPDQSPVRRISLSTGIRQAVADLKTVLPNLKRLPHFSRFFFAYLLYNDGIETVIVMASIFGSQELGMTKPQLITFFLMVQGIAFGGSLIFGWLADQLGNRRTILISLAGWIVVVLWGWRLGILGNPLAEYWTLGVLVALVMGGSQAASRSLQAMLIPPGRSAEFFSFFGISGRFASAVGPMIFGITVMITGSLRSGMLSLLVFFVSGFTLLALVDEVEGRRQALQFDSSAETGR